MVNVMIKMHFSLPIIHLIGWLVFFRLVKIGGSWIRWNGSLCWIVLNEIGWHRHLVINLFTRPQCMKHITLIQLLIFSQIDWLEVLGFVNSWLRKVPLGLSLSELGSWLIWTTDLDLAWLLLLINCPLFYIKDAIIFSFLISIRIWKEDCGTWLEKLYCLGKLCWYLRGWK